MPSDRRAAGPHGASPSALRLVFLCQRLRAAEPLPLERLPHRSPWLSWEALVPADPDVIFISPCGFDVARTMEETHLLTGKPEWGELKAVKENRVFVADGNQYFNRPGPRLVESLEILAEMLHPELFNFGYEGKGWVRLATLKAG